MAYIRCGGGGIPAALKTDMNAVLNKKFETSADYPPNTWADNVNLMGVLPIRSASGTIAKFNDGADTVPLKTLTLTALPTQSGTGDPSPTNPRTINSFSSLAVVQTGANLLDVSTGTIGVWIDSSGNETTALQGYVSEFIKTTGTTIKTNIFKQGDVSFFSCSICEYDKDKQFIRRDHHTTTALSSEISDTLSNTTAFVKFQIYLNGGMTQTALDNGDIMVSFGSATTFESYHATTHTLDLGQTCYGVSGDAVTGEFEKTWGVLDLSEISWTLTSNRARTTALSSLISIPPDNNTPTTAIAEKYTAIAWSGSLNDHQTSYAVASDGTLVFYYDGQTTPTGLFVYPLATPNEITADPVEVDSFEGVNCLWCTNENSSVAVEYRADIDLLISELGG